MHKLVAAALAVAKTQAGVTEQGHNGGPQVTAYLRATGLPAGNPWCAAFVAWCIGQAEKQTGVKCPLPKSASCDVLLTYGRKRGLLKTTPQPGDIFLKLDSPTDAVHTGFVTGVAAAGSFTTMEGNTNAAGGREGVMVRAHTRVVTPGDYTFLRWEAALAVDKPHATAAARALYSERVHPHLTEARSELMALLDGPAEAEALAQFNDLAEVTRAAGLRD
jgi:hypothetical protein